MVIARHGYNVGFGAKKNFATYDIVCKMPGWISLLSLAIGVFFLFIPALADNVVSATLIIIGVANKYVQFYDGTKEEYKVAGDAHTQIFNQLEVVYRNVKSGPDFDYPAVQQKVDALMKTFYQHTLSKQIFVSNCYAHYKFFLDMEKSWVEKEIVLTLRINFRSHCVYGGQFSSLF